MSELHVPIKIQKKKFKKSGRISLYDKEMNFVTSATYLGTFRRKEIIKQWERLHPNTTYYITIIPDISER